MQKEGDLAKGEKEKDGEDLAGEDDPHEKEGAHRFGDLIKSMLARLELNNSLAPIQEYGRHQKKANNKRKQAEKKKAPVDSADPSEHKDPETLPELQQPQTAGTVIPEKGPMQYDDKFYDLDDDFICDDELDVGEEIATEMLYNTSELPSHISDSKLSGLRGPGGEMLPPE